MTNRRNVIRTFAASSLLAVITSCDGASAPPTAPLTQAEIMFQANLVDGGGSLQPYNEIENHPGYYRVTLAYEFPFGAEHEVVIRPMVRTYGGAGDPAEGDLDQTLLLPEVRFARGTTRGDVAAEFDICGLARADCWTEEVRLEFIFIVDGEEFLDDDSLGDGLWPSNRECSDYQLRFPVTPVGSYC